MSSSSAVADKSTIEPAKKKDKYGWIPPVFYWVFGVITCAYYAYASIAICSNSDYLGWVVSPLALIAPINAIGLVYKGRPAQVKQHPTFFGTLNNIALSVSIALFVVLLPLIMLDALGMFFMIPFLVTDFRHMGDELGFYLMLFFYQAVAWGPLVTALTIRGGLSKVFAKKEERHWVPLGASAAIILSVVLVVLFPSMLTITCADLAMIGKKRPEALLLLRAFGNQEDLMRLCYDERAPLPFFFSFLSERDWDWRVDDNLQKRRETFYRVTGRPFNSFPRKHNVKPPLLPDFLVSSTSDVDDDYSWYRLYSTDFASDQVGGIERGLKLTRSALTGRLNSKEAVSHFKWQMQFSSTKDVHEFRAQILLPPKAVVNRCTLTIDGHEHEAIFAARSSTRKAYKEAAQEGERPMLVSTAGAGRILVQSSTGWWSKGALLNVEFAAPLSIDSLDRASIVLPRLSERDFSTDVPHSIELTTDDVATQLPPELMDKGSHKIAGNLTNAELSQGCLIQLKRDPSVTTVGGIETIDLNKSKEFLVQKIVTESGSPDTPVTFVVDGSGMMAKWLDKVCAALSNVDCRHASIIWASDIPSTVVENVDTKSPQWAQSIERLRDSSALGGQNDAEALKLALSKVAKDTPTNIVWFHDPQPVEFTGNELLPVLKAHPKTILREYQFEAGPNEVIKSVDKAINLVQLPQSKNIDGDLKTIVQQLSGAQKTYAISRELQPTATSKDAADKPEHGKEISDIYWASRALTNITDSKSMLQYGEVAETRHLVTPLSSALVLEKGNYQERGVLNNAGKPIPNAPAKGGGSGFLDNLSMPGQIPVKPEPPMWLLLLFAMPPIALILWKQQKSRVRAN